MKFKVCDEEITEKEFLDALENYGHSDLDNVIYYSLLELPSGGHVPIPKILEWGPEYIEKLRKVPFSKRIRDRNFYPTGFFDVYDPESEDTQIEFWAKEVIARKLLDEGQYDKMRIIVADPCEAYADCDDDWDYEDYEDDDDCVEVSFE